MPFDTNSISPVRIRVTINIKLATKVPIILCFEARWSYISITAAVWIPATNAVSCLPSASSIGLDGIVPTSFGFLDPNDDAQKTNHNENMAIIIWIAFIYQPILSHTTQVQEAILFQQSPSNLTRQRSSS